MNESYSWSNYSTTVAGNTLIGIESLDYDRSQKIETHYGKGNEAVGYGKGAKEGSGKLSVTLEEYEKFLLAAIPFGGDPLDIPPFPIVGLHEKPDGSSMKEILPLVVIEKMGQKRKVEDTKFLVDIDFKLLTMPKEIKI